MKSSSFLRRAIYYEQSPAALEYWEARVQSLFVKDASQSWVDAYSNTELRRTSARAATTNLIPQNDTELQEGALDHNATVNESSSDAGYVSEVQGIGRPEGEKQGLQLQKLQYKPELMQFLSVR
jgi:hypothetical protein